MKVHLATAVDEPWSRTLRAEVLELARRDRFRQHSVVSDPDEADIIVFLDAHQLLTDWRMHALRSHPYVRSYPSKVFVYDERDEPRDLLRGVYVGMPKARFDAKRHRAVGYYKLQTDTRSARDVEPDLLFSFQGRDTGGVRSRVLALESDRAFIENTTRHDFFSDVLPDTDAMRVRYKIVIARSKFVLCPRGAGTSSFRLFEALAGGRVPVVLSDDWVAPSGIDWTSCSVRIAQRDVTEVPCRLEALEAQWPALSRAASNTYDQWFGPEAWFHRMVDGCAELQPGRDPLVKRQSLTAAYWRAGARHWRHTGTARRLTTSQRGT